MPVPRLRRSSRIRSALLALLSFPVYIIVLRFSILGFARIDTAALGYRRGSGIGGSSYVDSNPHIRLTPERTFHISIFTDLHFGEAEDTPWGPEQDRNSTRVMNAVLDAELPDSSASLAASLTSSTSSSSSTFLDSLILPSWRDSYWFSLLSWFFESSPPEPQPKRKDNANRNHLTVLLGDLITGENAHRHNATHYLDRIVAPLVQRGLFWATVYGNHDSDVNLERRVIFEREKRLYGAREGRGGSLTEDMVSGRGMKKEGENEARAGLLGGGDEDVGVSNYYIPIFDYAKDDTETRTEESEGEAPVFILWFFDSRGGKRYHEQHQQDDTINGGTQTRSKSEDDTDLPNWVHAKVADWFLETNNRLVQKYGKEIPSLAFVHIPVSAMLAFQKSGNHNDENGDERSRRRRGVDKHRNPGINDDVPLAAQGNEWGLQDVPFMKALLQVQGLLGVFSG